MFVQVIRGQTSDAEAVDRLGQRWHDELAPGAPGFLGATNGVTADGEVVAIVRFADEASARRNSERPEQGEWWAQMAAAYDGEPAFAESGDVDQLINGDPDEATFVQVMEGAAADLDAARAFEHATSDALKSMRPDLLGLFRVNQPDGRFTQAAYFRSEADARQGEQQEPEAMPPDVAAGFQAYSENLKVDRYLDLTDPHLF